MEIELTELGFLSSTTTAFLKKSDNLTSLIPATHPFFSIENAIKEKENFSITNRQILVETLRNQYRTLSISDHHLVHKNIDALLEPGTFTVTTGQQLHLFLGPAFMVYKLISTIKAAEHYQLLYPDKKFVPIFWLASEDHDFEEIKNTPLFGQNYEWNTQQTGACGTYHLKDLPPLFEQLKLKLANDARGMQLISTFEEIYNHSATLSEATIRLVHHLFGQYGLVCLDANNRTLKSLFKPVLIKEITEMQSESIMTEFSNKMTDNQLSLQLKGRPINLFYLKDHIRARIEFKDNNYAVAGTELTFNKVSILKEIEEYPERFSPNAVLRPVYQETILPNVAYIAGNAEINYWIQLKEVFELYATGAAVLILRQSAWLINEKQITWLKAKNIEIKNLFALKTQEDMLRSVATETIENPFNELLNRFTEIKNEALDQAGKNGLKNLKEFSESGKVFEKNIKEFIKAKSELMTEKNKKDLIKLEQLINNGFSTKNIQERSVYSIDFLIKLPDYINFCFYKLGFKPGTGYFLQL